MITNTKLSEIVELEGWEYVLTELDPEELDDIELGELLADAQDSFRILKRYVPLSNDSAEYDSEYNYDDDLAGTGLEELNFDTDDD
jgi:hypothetical protein